MVAPGRSRAHIGVWQGTWGGAMRFPAERESAYREHMFVRELPRLRVFVLIAAPMLLLFAMLQAPLAGLPLSTWFAHPRIYVLAAILFGLGLWMRTMTRPAAFAWAGVLLLTLFCLSCALVIEPRGDAVAMTLPLFIAPPLITAPFWAHRRTVLVALTGGYLAGSVALLRADASQALWLAYAVQAILASLVGLLLHSVFDEVRRVHFLAEEELLQRVRLDSLTQLINRRHFVESGEAVIAAMAPTGLLSACFVDLDYFKRVNDEGGHRIGDLVLMETARRLLAMVREGRLVARLGGEEFALLLSSTPLEEAQVLAHTLCADIATISVEGFSVTASVGVAQWRHGESLSELLHRADMALLEAKRGGRNRIVEWSPGLKAVV